MAPTTRPGTGQEVLCALQVSLFVVEDSILDYVQILRHLRPATFLFQQVAVEQLLEGSDSLPSLLFKALQPHKFEVEEPPQDESIDEIFLRDSSHKSIAHHVLTR